MDLSLAAGERPDFDGVDAATPGVIVRRVRRAHTGCIQNTRERGSMGKVVSTIDIVCRGKQFMIGTLTLQC